MPFIESVNGSLRDELLPTRGFFDKPLDDARRKLALLAIRLQQRQTPLHSLRNKAPAEARRALSNLRATATRRRLPKLTMKNMKSKTGKLSL